MMNRSNTIDFFSAVLLKESQQDTVINQSVPKTQVDTSPLIQADKDTIRDSINTALQLDTAAIDSILQASEQREKMIQQQQAERELAIQRWRQRKVDTTELLYKQFGIAGFPIKEQLDSDLTTQNFLYHIPIVKPKVEQVTQDVFIEAKETTLNSKAQKETHQTADSQIKPKYIEGKVQFDWVTIVLIASFLLLGWIRLFSRKYLSSLVKAIISYQESNTLYRDKNSLTERASFMLNLLFFSNISVFTIQLRHFWNVELAIEDLSLYGIVFASLVALYIFREISSWFIGYVFLKQSVFSEYFHNVNIFTKNNGLLLFPIVVVLQFLSFEYIPVVVYAGLSISAALYLLQLVRAFQIIIRKNVSIFYMILYLCAFEIAPFLIVYKILLSLA